MDATAPRRPAASGSPPPLADWLADRAETDDLRRAVVRTVTALAAAACRIADGVARGPLAGAPGAERGAANADGDARKALDVRANEEVMSALAGAPVAYYASEEEDAIVSLAPGAPLAVAADPLDGSSNIDVDVSIGTLFSIFPAADSATASFFRPGSEQLAAGYVVYGPHTALTFTVGDGVAVFVREPGSGTWRLARYPVQIPVSTREFAINASNYRHWASPVRTFVDDCVAGAEGPRGKDFNMRWVASLVAETHRIFTRGGVFLYPADRRQGYGSGRLRLLYEAAPIAMLAEQAGGRATDCVERILDRVPETLHERTPLVFGSAEKVDRITAYHVNPAFSREVSPLFRDRGLFQR